MSNKLDKVIEIGGVDYEVQAKISEKVEKQLTIKEISKNSSGAVTTNSVPFDGSAAATVSVVSAENGGYFKKPIGVPSLNGATPTADQVLNYGDLSAVTATLAGSGWYTWNGSSFAAVVKNSVNQHLGIVVGTEGALASFVTKNNASKYLPKFLYICGDSGNLFYGDDNNYYTQIVNESYTIKSTTGGTNYTADSITTALAGLDQKITDLGKLTGDNAAELLTELREVDTSLQEQISSNDTDIASINTWLNNMTSEVTTDTTTVNKAKTASNAEKLNNQSATYYQKAITISTAEPSGGSVGDIWIVYK